MICDYCKKSLIDKGNLEYIFHKYICPDRLYVNAMEELNLLKENDKITEFQLFLYQEELLQSLRSIFNDDIIKNSINLKYSIQSDPVSSLTLNQSLAQQNLSNLQWSQSSIIVKSESKCSEDQQVQNSDFSIQLMIENLDRQEDQQRNQVQQTIQSEHSIEIELSEIEINRDCKKKKRKRHKKQQYKKNNQKLLQKKKVQKIQNSSICIVLSQQLDNNEDFEQHLISEPNQSVKQKSQKQTKKIKKEKSKK